MLSRVVLPFTEAEFFRDYWTKKFLHIPGSPEKFSELFGWNVLNRALEEQRVDSKRLRLVKAGKDVDPKRYRNGPYVNAPRLVNELSNGATIVFNQCEEVHVPLRELCVYLEGLFHVNVSANLYAGWCEDNGFDVHWDTQDVLILQVSGRKRWKVWNPTRLYPFENEEGVMSNKQEPDGDPIWDGVLEPGDALSIPRGWWHIATPMNEPCLHLTVTICNLNGIDLMRWIAGKMKQSETARMELPVIASALDRKVWLEQVKRDLDALWGDTLIDDYLAEVDGEAISRPSLSLPSAADARNHNLNITTPIRLAIPRTLHFKFDNEGASLNANGTTWNIKRSVAERLQRFNDFHVHTLEELNPESDFRVVTMVMALIRGGVLQAN
jgi:ribosomal protein L16 Arg81 hydroxylase